MNRPLRRPAIFADYPRIAVHAHTRRTQPPKVVVGRKNWMFYGSNSHADRAAAIFSLVASCRLHGIDPEQYFDEVMRALPDWPKDRYLKLSRKHWRATRGNLLPSDLESPLCAFTVRPAALNFAR